MKKTSQIEKLKNLYNEKIDPMLPPVLKATAMLRGFGLLKVPMLYYVRPTVMSITDKKAIVKIPLTRKSKNHLNSMYFGALSVGADCVVGMLALHLIHKEKGGNVHLSFKDFKADFLKRAEGGDVHFVCEEGHKIEKAVKDALESGERSNTPIDAYAIVPSKSKEDPVAKFTLTLSLKKK